MHAVRLCTPSVCFSHSLNIVPTPVKKGKFELRCLVTTAGIFHYVEGAMRKLIVWWQQTMSGAPATVMVMATSSSMMPSRMENVKGWWDDVGQPNPPTSRVLWCWWLTTSAVPSRFKSFCFLHYSCSCFDFLHTLWRFSFCMSFLWVIVIWVKTWRTLTSSDSFLLNVAHADLIRR